MDVSRRTFLRSLSAAGALAACAGPVFAANRAGLAPGRFVWQPTLAPEGPVLVSFSAEEELVRIFRNGVEIGISTCRVRSARNDVDWSVFSIAGESAKLDLGAPLAWAGRPVHAAAPRGLARATPLVTLPPDLAPLVAEAAGPGAVVALASRSSRPHIVVGAGLLPTGVSLIGTQALAGQPASNDAAAPPEGPAILVVSAHDRMAYLRREGQPEISGRIAVVDTGRPLGDRLLSLIEVGREAERSRWLGLDLAPAADGIGNAMGRITLSGGQLTPYVVAAAMSPGSTLLLTDRPAPPLTRTAGRPHALLASQAKPEAAPTAGRGGHVLRVRAGATAEPTIKPLDFFRDY